MANAKYINIYALVSEIEPNNIKYVGVTRRNPKYRLNNHLYEAKHTPNKNNRTKWINSVNSKIFQIILDVIDEENCDFWEKYWISQVKAWGFDLVNSNNGGGGLSKRDDNFSKWLSQRSIGNKYNLGKKHSPEAIKNISNGHIGIPNQNKGKKLNSEWISNLSKAKLGKPSNAKGFKHTEETKNKKRKRVIQMDVNGVIINEFNSVSETAIFFNTPISSISKVLNKNKKYKKFVFKSKINE